MLAGTKPFAEPPTDPQQFLPESIVVDFEGRSCNRMNSPVLLAQMMFLLIIPILNKIKVLILRLFGMISRKTIGFKLQHYDGLT